MQNRFEVIVIGGGAVGSSITYRLAQAGKRVCLVEKGFITAGTTGATFAWIGAHGQTPLSYYQLRKASLDIYTSLSAELGVDIEYRTGGSLVLVEHDQDLESVRRQVEQRQAEGYALYFLSPHELHEKEPHIMAERFEGATYCPLGGSVDPFALAYGFAKRAQELGAVLYTQTSVQAIQLHNGRVKAVITDRGALETEWVVNAAGPFAPQIARMVGIQLPMTLVRGQVLVTEPLPPLFHHVISETKQTPRGNVLLGKTEEEVELDRRNTVEGMQSIAQKAARRFPFLRTTHIIRAYAGIRPMPHDGLPILGPVEGIEGFLLATMHSGITLSPVVGKLISELIVTGKPSLSLQEYALSRFASPVVH